MEKALLKQSDKCNALAVKLWMDDTGGDSSKLRMSYLSRGQWRVLQRLVKELDKDKYQATELRSATDNKFADADKNFSLLSDPSHKWLAQHFISDHAKYTEMLDRVLTNLDQAEQLALRLNPLRTDLNALNFP